MTPTEFQEYVIVGTLLGDSSLSCPSNGVNYHLSCYHAKKQAEWLTMKHAWLAPISRPLHWCAYLDKRDGKTREGGRFHTVSIPFFTTIASELYKRRTKVITAAYLGRFTHPVSLACLIGDDGSWDGAGIAIASKQFTIKENRSLAARIADTFGLSVSVMDRQRYPYLRITASSVEKCRELCRPFLPDTLMYKFGPEGYKTTLVAKLSKPCGSCHKEFLSYASAERQFCSVECRVKGSPRRWSGGRSSPRY